LSWESCNEKSKNFNFTLSLVVLINYINYILPDRDKLNQQITLLEKKIKKQEKLNTQHINIKDLNVSHSRLFFSGKQYNYSQSMGLMQKIITKSAKNNCSVSRIKWSQVPQTQEWYESLKMNVTLECSPDGVYQFVNTLREEKTLFVTKNFRVNKLKKKNKLLLRFQLIAFRKKNEK
jgi:hypothetical protein